MNQKTADQQQRKKQEEEQGESMFMYNYDIRCTSCGIDVASAKSLFLCGGCVCFLCADCYGIVGWGQIGKDYIPTTHCEKCLKKERNWLIIIIAAIAINVMSLCYLAYKVL